MRADKWVEAQRVRLGDTVEIRRQRLVVTEVIQGEEKGVVILVGEADDGRQVAYKGAVDESIKLLPGEVE